MCCSSWEEVIISQSLISQWPHSARSWYCMFFDAAIKPLSLLCSHWIMDYNANLAFLAPHTPMIPMISISTIFQLAFSGARMTSWRRLPQVRVFRSISSPWPRTGHDRQWPAKTKRPARLARLARPDLPRWHCVPCCKHQNKMMCGDTTLICLSDATSILDLKWLWNTSGRLDTRVYQSLAFRPLIWNPIMAWMANPFWQFDIYIILYEIFI